ncbi:13404_t:CDS:2, partial [Racocetra fulgida]
MKTSTSQDQGSIQKISFFSENTTSFSHEQKTIQSESHNETGLLQNIEESKKTLPETNSKDLTE